MYVYPLRVNLRRIGAPTCFEQARRPVEVGALSHIQDCEYVYEVAFQRGAHYEVAECLCGGRRACRGIFGFARAKLGKCTLEQVVLRTQRRQELHQRVAVLDGRRFRRTERNHWHEVLHEDIVLQEIAAELLRRQRPVAHLLDERVGNHPLPKLAIGFSQLRGQRHLDISP